MNSPTHLDLPYTGRFAPSPSGALHFGSLVCALASYLDARLQGGRWLVRIEDIDPPREAPGAGDTILRCLEQHQLNWDGAVIWQSQRAEQYRAVLHQLEQQGLIYRCSCTRKRLDALGHRYDGFCRQQTAALPAAWRLRVPQQMNIEFHDRHLGTQHDDVSAQGDFIIHRKDGLFAYTLAVVVDDWQQGITHVVRGSDLLEATGKQIYLFSLLQTAAPTYGHIPVITNPMGFKLSKQNHAPALNRATPGHNLWRALWALGTKAPDQLAHAPADQVLAWALQHWRWQNLPAGMSQCESTLPN